MWQDENVGQDIMTFGESITDKSGFPFTVIIFCPTDGYLRAIRDKFGCLETGFVCRRVKSHRAMLQWSFQEVHD